MTVVAPKARGFVPAINSAGRFLSLPPLARNLCVCVFKPCSIFISRFLLFDCADFVFFVSRGVFVLYGGFVVACLFVDYVFFFQLLFVFCFGFCVLCVFIFLVFVFLFSFVCFYFKKNCCSRRVDWSP